MRLFIDSRLVGSASNFVWDDGKIAVNDDAECHWYLRHAGKRHKCVRAASEAAGYNLLSDPVVPQAAFWRKHTPNPAWCRILSKEQFRIYLEEQIQRVLNFVEDPRNAYFTSHYQVQQSLIDRLQPGRVIDDSLSDHGFLPDADGFVRVPDYDNAHSSTGRMSIQGGPKILTLPRGLRSRLTSRWADGKLVEVDFNSLEARVLGWISGHDQIAGDMYEWIGKESGAESAPRAIVKEATLSAIYGMSKRNFALRYQDMPDAIEIYENVRRLMGVQDLERRLASEQIFLNAFGRPLADTTAKVSHYVQSSAVDIACSGFHWLADAIDSRKALPVYLIHDAMVLDVKSEYLDELRTICKAGLPISTINQKFPVKVKEFNCD